GTVVEARLGASRRDTSFGRRASVWVLGAVAASLATVFAASCVPEPAPSTLEVRVDVLTGTVESLDVVVPKSKQLISARSADAEGVAVTGSASAEEAGGITVSITAALEASPGSRVARLNVS